MVLWNESKHILKDDGLSLYIRCFAIVFDSRTLCLRPINCMCYYRLKSKQHERNHRVGDGRSEILPQLKRGLRPGRFPANGSLRFFNLKLQQLHFYFVPGRAAFGWSRLFSRGPTEKGMPGGVSELKSARLCGISVRI